MEFMLLLWDEYDDVTAAVRHMVSSTADELAGLGAPVAAASTALVGWFIAPFLQLFVK